MQCGRSSRARTDTAHTSGLGSLKPGSHAPGSPSGSRIQRARISRIQRTIPLRRRSGTLTAVQSRRHVADIRDRLVHTCMLAVIPTARMARMTTVIRMRHISRIHGSESHRGLRSRDVTVTRGIVTRRVAIVLGRVEVERLLRMVTGER